MGVVMVLTCLFAFILDPTKSPWPPSPVLVVAGLGGNRLPERHNDSRLGRSDIKNDRRPVLEGGYKPPQASCGLGGKKIRNNFTRVSGRFCQLAARPVREVGTRFARSRRVVRCLAGVRRASKCGSGRLRGLGSAACVRFLGWLKEEASIPPKKLTRQAPKISAEQIISAEPSK